MQTSSSTIRPMVAARLAVARIACAIAVASCIGIAHAGEFTVVGSPVRNSAKGPCCPVKPDPCAEEIGLATSTGTATAESDDMAVAQQPDCWLQRFTYDCRPLERDWYARFDYYSWKEQTGNHGNSVDEHGALYTLGYARTNGRNRIRVEAFTGVLNYTPGDLGGVPGLMVTTSRHVGARVEYELLWNYNLDDGQSIQFFSGFGTRVWVRDIQDCQLGPNEWLAGHTETWLTLYPYLGMERKWLYEECTEFYLSCRIGSTAWTYQSCSTLDGPVLNPQACMTGQIEFGMRYEEHFFMAAYFDAMTWGQSRWVDGAYQPDSQMYTTGFKIGLHF